MPEVQKAWCVKHGRILVLWSVHGAGPEYAVADYYNMELDKALELMERGLGSDTSVVEVSVTEHDAAIKARESTP